MNTLLPNSYAAQGMKLPALREPPGGRAAGRRHALPKPGLITTQIPNVPGDRAPMSSFILPSARDRWMASNLHFYTASVIENTARSAVSGNMMALWLMFDLMEQTWPRLSKNLNELKNAAVDLDWDLQAFAYEGQKPSKEAIRRKQAVKMVLWDMAPDKKKNENDFDDTLRDVLDAVGKGISVLETDWQQKQYPIGNLWRPRSTRWVHPRYYGYPPYGVGADELMLNAHEVLASNPSLTFEQLAAEAGPLNIPPGPSLQWIPFPPNRYIISIIKQKTGHPLTASLLRILGFFWAAQNFTWEWFINLAQIFGMPFRWVTYDPTQKALLPLIEQMLARMGSQAWGAFPDGTNLKMEKGVENTKDNPQKVLIDSCDEICDIVILGQTLTTTQGSRGSQSVGNIHKDVRDERIRGVGRRAANTMNTEMIPAICRLNFGDDRECPTLIIPAEEEDSAIERAQRDQIILSSGADVPKSWYYERHSIPVPDAGEEVIKGNPGADPGARPPRMIRRASRNPNSATARNRARYPRPARAGRIPWRRSPTMSWRMFPACRRAGWARSSRCSASWWPPRRTTTSPTRNSSGRWRPRRNIFRSCSTASTATRCSPQWKRRWAPRPSTAPSPATSPGGPHDCHRPG